MGTQKLRRRPASPPLLHLHALPQPDRRGRVEARLGHQHQADIVGLGLLGARPGPLEDQVDAESGDEVGDVEQVAEQDERDVQDELGGEAFGAVVGEGVGDFVGEDGGEAGFGAGDGQEAGEDEDFAAGNGDLVQRGREGFGLASSLKRI